MTSVAAIDQRNARVGMLAILGALAMLGLGYASVPLYQLFCQATGFGGTTQRASESDADIAARIAQSAGGKTISIRFDATTAGDLPWTFRPAKPTDRSEAHTSELQSLMRISYAVFCLKQKKNRSA